MDIRINNSVTVNRMWSELEDGEIIAVFQYVDDARYFAKFKAEDKRAAQSYFIVADSGSGNVWVVRPQKSDVAQAA